MNAGATVKQTSCIPRLNVELALLTCILDLQTYYALLKGSFRKSKRPIYPKHRQLNNTELEADDVPIASNNVPRPRATAKVQALAFIP
jgi:hypothetical protein